MKEQLLSRRKEALKLLALIILILPVIKSYGQSTPNANQIFWSSTKKLTVNDFGIKTKNQETNISFAQFSVDYQVSGLDFMTRNFNKKVRNYMIKSASTIDTTADVSISLRYQQTLFDICEIYTRQFRKALKENRKKIASGVEFIEELNQQAMTDFANRRVLYDKETNFGTLNDKQKEWEKLIQKELALLIEFANE